MDRYGEIARSIVAEFAGSWELKRSDIVAAILREAFPEPALPRVKLVTDYGDRVTIEECEVSSDQSGDVLMVRRIVPEEPAPAEQREGLLDDIVSIIREEGYSTDPFRLSHKTAERLRALLASRPQPAAALTCSSEAFDELRAKFGKHFDKLDVDEFMRECRGEPAVAKDTRELAGKIMTIQPKEGTIVSALEAQEKITAEIERFFAARLAERAPSGYVNLSGHAALDLRVPSLSAESPMSTEETK
jgi:hypothetical protein